MKILKLFILLSVFSFFVGLVGMEPKAETDYMSQMPPEVILDIARKTINWDATTVKDALKSAVNLFSTNKYLHSLQPLFLKSKTVAELRDKLDEKWVEAKMKGYVDEQSKKFKLWWAKPGASSVGINEKINALHLATALADVEFLKKVLPVLLRLKKFDIINQRIPIDLVVSTGYPGDYNAKEVDVFKNHTPFQVGSTQILINGKYSPEIVNLLLANGADANVANFNKEIPIEEDLEKIQSRFGRLHWIIRDIPNADTDDKKRLNHYLEDEIENIGALTKIVQILLKNTKQEVVEKMKEKYLKKAASSIDYKYYTRLFNQEPINVLEIIKNN